LGQLPKSKIDDSSPLKKFRRPKIKRIAMKSKKVLIVDDNELNRKLFENLIGQIYEYELANNGIEAVELATKTPFDLILMDIQMPLLDGIKALKQIREHKFGSCPILAVTAYADEVDKQSFLDQGFDDFVAKPIRPRELLVLVQSFFEKISKVDIKKQEESLPGIILNSSTLANLLKYNSKEFIKNIYLDFLSECEETLKILDNAIETKITDELLNKLHTLKGNSGTLGAERIFHYCQICESFGRKNKLSEFVDNLAFLKNEIREFDKFLNQSTIFES